MNYNLVLYSIVIPVYNEENTIAFSLRQIENYSNKIMIKYEITLVDDGSVDKTKEKIKYAIDSNQKIKLLENSSNKGKGSAVKKGVLNSRGDYIIFMDADLSTPVEEMSKIIDAASSDRAAIFIGVRDEKREGTKVTRPYIRRLISRIYNFTVNLLFDLRIQDVGCGFKCFPAKIAQEIFQRQYIKGWVFDIEALIRARRMGFKIKEIPVSWENHLPTHVNIIPDALYCFCDLMKLFFLNLFKKI